MQQHTWNELTVQLWPKCIHYQGRMPAYETAIPSKWCSLILAFLDRATMPLIWFQSSHISGMGTVLVKCKPSRIFNSTKKSGQYHPPTPQQHRKPNDSAMPPRKGHPHPQIQGIAIISILQTDKFQGASISQSSSQGAPSPKTVWKPAAP